MLVACDQGAKQEPPAPKPLPKPEPVKAADWLTYLPANADTAFRIDVSAIRQTKFWATYEPKVWQRFDVWFDACGYNPLPKLVSIAGAILADDRRVLVFRGIDRDKTLACLRGVKPAGKKVELIGSYVTITNEDGSVTSLTFVDRMTLVLASKTTGDALAEIVNSGAPLRSSTALVALDNKIPHDAVAAIFMPPTSKQLSATFGKKPLDAYGVFSLRDKLKIDFFMRFATADDAKSLADQIRPTLKSTQSFFETADVGAQDGTLHMAFTMTDKQLDTMVPAFANAW
jgi:hypothetical protein